MFVFKSSFSGFSVDNLQAAKVFYRDTLGIAIHEEEDMGFSLQLPGGNQPFIYPKADHMPASFTVLNFVVDNIDEAMQAMEATGIAFLIYEQQDLPQDDKGVLRGLQAGRVRI